MMPGAKLVNKGLDGDCTSPRKIRSILRANTEMKTCLRTNEGFDDNMSNSMVALKADDVSSATDSSASSLSSDASSLPADVIKFIEEGCGVDEGCGPASYLGLRSLLADFAGYVFGIERRCACCQQPIVSSQSGLMRNASTGKWVFIHFDCYDTIGASRKTAESSTPPKHVDVNEKKKSSTDSNKMLLEQNGAEVQPRREQQRKNEGSHIVPESETITNKTNAATQSKISPKNGEIRIALKRDISIKKKNTATQSKISPKTEQRRNTTKREAMIKQANTATQSKISPRRSIKSKSADEIGLAPTLRNKQKSARNQRRLSLKKKQSPKNKQGNDSKKDLERKGSPTSQPGKGAMKPNEEKNTVKKQETRRPITRAKIESTPENITTAKVKRFAGFKYPERKIK